MARLEPCFLKSHGIRKTVVIDATYLKTHRGATSLGVK
jgi:hypothetical protein